MLDQKLIASEYFPEVESSVSRGIGVVFETLYFGSLSSPQQYSLRRGTIGLGNWRAMCVTDDEDLHAALHDLSRGVINKDMVVF